MCGAAVSEQLKMELVCEEHASVIGATEGVRVREQQLGVGQLKVVQIYVKSR